MKKLLTVIGLMGCVFVSGQPIDKTEWAAYMHHNSLYWDSLGTGYYDGIIAGNGRLGVNMYREGASALRFDVGRSDVTDQRHHYPDSLFAEQLVSHPRLPLGKMVIRTSGEIVSSSIYLDIYNAEVKGEILTSKGRVNLYFFVPSGEDIIHIEATDIAGTEKLICEWVTEKSFSPRIAYLSTEAKSFAYQHNPDSKLTDSAGHGICYQSLYSKGEYATVWRHALSGDKHIIDIAVGYSDSLKGRAIPEAFAAIRRFQSKPLGVVVDAHKVWWNNFFQRSFISIPDKRIESYYWLQIYKLGSATRKNMPMIDLMGPWFTSKTPWPGIWWNLNTQLTYSPLFTANQLELTRPLFDLLNKNKQQLINNVPVQWRGDAAAIGRVSSYDLWSPLSQHNLKDGQFEPGNLLWVMLYYYKYYQYSGDKVELKEKIYPLLKKSVNYLLHLLHADDKDILHLVKSHSPEYADVEDAHYSLAGLIWGLQTLMEVNQLLGLNDADKHSWSKVLQALTPLHSNDHGFMVGKDVELTSSHRHYSHLMAIYPYRLLDMSNPSHRSTTLKSIHHWQSMSDALAGYSYTGASSMYSLLGEGDSSVALLGKFLDRHAQPNGLYAEAGPCFETPMAFAASLQEMLIQSDKGHIIIFPAIPQAWRELSFSQLGAEGAFLIDAVLYDGILQQVKAKSLSGNTCSLELNASGDFEVISDRRGILQSVVQRQSGHLLFTFETIAGELITVKRKNVSTARDLLVHFQENKFYWGLNRFFLTR